MDAIRVLKIGLGGAGGGNLKLAAGTAGLKVVGGVDVVAKVRKAVARQYGIPTFARLEEGLRAVSAEAAIISTPNRFHAPYAIACMRAGLDVLTEKPMATSPAEARHMHRVAQQTGRILMVKQNLRWVPVHMAAAALLRQGVVGRLRQIDYDFYVFNAGAVRGFRRRIPQLLFEDLGIHHFDLLRFLIGRPARSIYAVSWPSVGRPTAPVASAGRAILEFDGPVTVSYRGEMLSITDSTTYLCRYTVTGTRGALWVRDGKVLVRSREAALRQEPPRELPAEEVQRHCPETFMDAFVRAVRTRRPPMTSSADNLQSLALMFGAMESAQTGRVVRLKELSA